MLYNSLNTFYPIVRATTFVRDSKDLNISTHFSKNDCERKLFKRNTPDIGLSLYPITMHRTYHIHHNFFKFSKVCRTQTDLS